MKSLSDFCRTAVLIPCVLLLVCLPAFGQRFCPPGGCCPPVINQPYFAPIVAPPVVVVNEVANAANWYKTLYFSRGTTVPPQDEATVRSWSRRAVRILNGNSCGSGSLCGRDAQFIYILTNAHVAGTKIGHSVDCEALLSDGQATEKFNAVVIEAAYSGKTSTDWALLRAEAKHMANLDPIPLSITAPEFDGLSGTWGCPRCEVPSGQVVRTVDLKSLWFWQPNSIGGQSGSAVVQKATQKGLLTWTWGGNGAGQLTETIYRQHVKQNTDGPARLDGLIPVTPVPAGLVLEEGYFSQSDLGNYPIWDNGNTNPDPDPSDPDCPPAVEPEDDEDVKRFKLLRDRFRDRGYNWVAILNLIFQLLEEFTKGR